MTDPSPLPPPALGGATAVSLGGPAAQLDNTRRWQYIGLGGCALIVIGRLGPWATLTSGFGTASVAGTSGDGWIVIGLAAAAAAGLATSAWVLRWIGALGALAVGGYDWQNLRSRIADVNSSSAIVEASVGWGLWAVIVGAVATTFGAALVPKGAKLIT